MTPVLAEQADELVDRVLERGPVLLHVPPRPAALADRTGVGEQVIKFGFQLGKPVPGDVVNAFHVLDAGDILHVPPKRVLAVVQYEAGGVEAVTSRSWPLAL